MHLSSRCRGYPSMWMRSRGLYWSHSQPLGGHPRRVLDQLFDKIRSGSQDKGMYKLFFSNAEVRRIVLIHDGKPTVGKREQWCSQSLSSAYTCRVQTSVNNRKIQLPLKQNKKPKTRETLTKKFQINWMPVLPRNYSAIYNLVDLNSSTGSVFLLGSRPQKRF